MIRAYGVKEKVVLSVAVHRHAEETRILGCSVLIELRDGYDSEPADSVLAWRAARLPR
jgi:hypothetical protein